MSSTADAPASLSTACDDLLEQLNDISFLGDPVHKDRCTHLRHSLTHLNLGQGLGFRIAGIVIDKRYLLKLVAAVGSAGGGLITTLIALGVKDEIDAAGSA